jgi:RNA polymerase sigma factor (sigma-70 family)
MPNVRQRSCTKDQATLENPDTVRAMTPLDHRKLLAGDPLTTQAFLKYIRSHVRRYFHRRSQIHDVSQAAMLDILARLRAGEEPEPDRVHYWVLNCANNAVKRELTRLRHRAVSYESRLHSSPQPSPSAVLGAREKIERIDRLLADCGEVGRKALEATVQGHNHREIAEQLDMGPGAVRMTISRVRAVLSERLTAEEKLGRLRLLAKHAGHRRPSLFRTKPGSSTGG